MSGPARSRDHRREALRRAVNLFYQFLRAPPQRASGDVCFLLTFDLHGGRLLGIWPKWNLTLGGIQPTNCPILRAQLADCRGQVSESRIHWLTSLKQARCKIIFRSILVFS